MTTTQPRAYPAPMHTDNATPAPEPLQQPSTSPLAEWRALWALEDGQPAWVGSAVSAMDGAIQGEMGHS